MTKEAGQVDLATSKARSLGIVAIGLGFLAACGAYLRLSGVSGGSVAAFAMVAGLLLGLAGVAGGLVQLLRRGPVVSVGPAGIFDRRLSDDWIPWTAIRSVSTATIHNQTFLMLETDPAQDAALPIKSMARRLMAANRGIGFDGYAVSATTLTGGFPALLAAVQRATAVRS